MALNNCELRREIGSTFNFQTSMRALFLAAALVALSAAACFAQGKVIRRGPRLGKLRGLVDARGASSASRSAVVYGF